MIKNILVPTDFSLCAENAILQAFDLANLTGAKVHVIHVADIPEDWENWPPRAQDEDPANKVKAQEAMAKLQTIYDEGVQRDIDVSVSYAGGKVINNIKEMADKDKSDFIIIGSHGKSGKEEYFIGSNTQKVVRKVNVPVLVVKEHSHYVKFETAVFATSLLQSEMEPFAKFVELLRPFGLKKIHIVAIDLSGYFDQPAIIMKEALKDFALIAKSIECETHFFRDYSVESGIRHFSDKINADIIGISNHDRSPLKRMLVGSNVELLINHATQPVLSIDYKN